VVFCRNVLIYLNPQSLQRFLELLDAWLPPDGYLFLASTESLWQVTDRFGLVRVGDAFVYRSARHSVPADQALPRPSRELGPRPPSVRPSPDLALLLAEGEAALTDGNVGVAVEAFRKACYVDLGNPIPHYHLGFALDAAGRRADATRAYTAARRALQRSDTTGEEAYLEGYSAGALAGFLDRRLGGHPSAFQDMYC
jgi:chemotaxis protein methyltransferase CheR